MKREKIFLIKAPQQWKPKAKISPPEPTDVTFAHAVLVHPERTEVRWSSTSTGALLCLHRHLHKQNIFWLEGTSWDLPVLPHVHPFIPPVCGSTTDTTHWSTTWNSHLQAVNLWIFFKDINFPGLNSNKHFHSLLEHVSTSNNCRCSFALVFPLVSYPSQVSPAYMSAYKCLSLERDLAIPSNRHTKIPAEDRENDGGCSLFLEDKLSTSQTSHKYFKSQIICLVSDFTTQKTKMIMF